MIRLAATSPLALVFATTAALSAGCFDTASSSTTLDYPTLLTIDPVHFRGSVTCGAPGLARYVVTLFDVSEPPMNCASPPCSTTTSIPVRCQHQVSFGEPPLQHRHFYTAIIEGYTRDDVKQKEPGSRDMLDPSSDEIIAPTWTTTCGELPPPAPPAEDAGLEDAEANAATDGPPYNPLRFPTMVLGKAEVVMHGCVPLAEASKPDASTDDGSVPPEDASEDAFIDAQPPEEGGFEAGEAAAPDSSGPEPEDAAGEGGEEDGPDTDGAEDDAGIEKAGRAKSGRR